MFDTLSSEGYKCNLIHCFNTERKDEEKHERARENEEGMADTKERFLLQVVGASSNNTTRKHTL
jgi:hypothetical protein